MSFFFFFCSSADKTLLNVAYLKPDQRTRRDVSRIFNSCSGSSSVYIHLFGAHPGISHPLVGVMVCDMLCSSLSFRLHSLTVFWEIALTVQVSVMSQNGSCVSLRTALLRTIWTTCQQWLKTNDIFRTTFPPTTTHNCYNVMKPFYHSQIFSNSFRSVRKHNIRKSQTTLHIQRCREFHVRQNSQCSHILTGVMCQYRRKLCTSKRRKLIF